MFLRAKKYFILLFVILLFSCRTSIIKTQGKVLDAFTDDVYYGFKFNERVDKYGIVYKEIEDYNYLINYDYEKLIEYDAFRVKLKDSLLKQLFSEKSISHFRKQLRKDYFNLEKIVFKRKNIEAYSDDIAIKKQNHKHHQVNVSKPIFSLNNKFSIVFSYTYHDAYAYIFKKDKNKWKLMFRHNLYSPNEGY